MSERSVPGGDGTTRRGTKAEARAEGASRPIDGSRTAGESTAGPVLARFDRPRAETPTTLALVADPHCSTRRTGTWKCFHRTEPRLRAAVAACNADGVDAVVLAGDLTADGYRTDFEAVHDALAGLAAPAFAVPGNHDVPKAFDDHETPSLTAFERRFTPGGLPFHVSVGGVDLVGIDTATAPDGSLDDGHGGRVGHEQLAWLDEVLPHLGTPLVVGHHNLAGELGEVPAATARPTFPLVDATALLETLAVHDVPLYCSGHLHVPGVDATAGVRQLVAPALSSFPQGYLRIAVGQTGTTVRYVPVAGPAGLEESYMAARTETGRIEAVVETTADQLARLPLRDESTGD